MIMYAITFDDGSKLMEKELSDRIKYLLEDGKCSVTLVSVEDNNEPNWNSGR